MRIRIVAFTLVTAALRPVPARRQRCRRRLESDPIGKPGAIAEAIGINTGSASRMVDRLLPAGLVTRTADEEDRRRVIVNVTQAALDRIATHYDPLNASLLEHLGQMDEHARSQMLRFINEAEKITD